MFHRPLREADPAVAEFLHEDLKRQQDNLVLIPSENYASPAVLQAQGSVMTNKYAEGYPGRRYYNGCEFMDAIESLAIGRAKQIFRADHANVQPHSGSQANVAVFQALLEPGDRILGMELTHGGHLSHGIPQNIAGRVYDAAFYGVEEGTGLVDLNRVRDIARKHKPRLIVVGGSAYPRTIDFAPWREIADEVGAYLLADIAHIAGLIAAGEHPDPVPYADAVSLTTHKTMRGPRGAIILCREEHAEAIDKAIFPGLQGGPFMHAIAARAVNLHEVMQPQFRFYIRQVMANARALADRLLSRGFDLVSGGTDTHLMLVDLANRPFSGRRAADRLEEAGMIVNRNTIPFDKRSPYVTSGIRPGTPAVTTRGMGVEEMHLIGDFMAEGVKKKTGEAGRAAIRAQVTELCARFPIYPGRDC
ncbi:serine hydroxymethyltransferase [Candidatus Poribacteria bacterium]|nr:serine hydroxymethyltransferase [Candidatus Poribacteria bacterium]MBT5712462.1 serine hydroxymethyltransferase [Candidatus Poribacteria bacterium]MBT7101195.1 serine hydroxymethyltransferase [Candidatus Poribacteria bacterium]MBT7808264.1 serine hydroxymethyltransferase [Candidatus Poribacteria bacterium]